MNRKSFQQKSQTKDEMFDALVKNAIDFVNSSLDIIDRRPKNSIIDFYTAIELFLKARLMAEHWTLMIGKPESATLENFSVGDFQSVYLEECAKRLKNIVDEPLKNKALENFKALNEHRNQIVHFAHTDYPDISGAKASVAIEQWTSWHYLHELLTVQWSTTFINYRTDIDRLHSRMMAQKDFIKVRYKELKPNICEKENAGAVSMKCRDCDMKAAFIHTTHDWGHDFECLVCTAEWTQPMPTTATLQCEGCGYDFEFFNSKIIACPICQQNIDTDKRISLCDKKYTKGDEWWEVGNPYTAECHVCKYHRASVFYIDGLWSCVSCFDRGWQAIACEHCEEFVTGDMETIKYIGCFKCQDASQ